MWVHVGCQAIVDSRGVPAGQELRVNAVGGEDDDAAAAALTSAVDDLGVSGLVGDQLMFVNPARPFLLGEQSLPFPPGQVVLEVLRHIEPDDALLDGVRRLVERRFVVAVDHVTAQRSPDVLLPLARYVLIDVGATTDLPGLVGSMTRQRQRPVAVGVRTASQLAACQALGIALFQGELFSDPRAIGQSSPTAYNLACLRLVSMLAQAEVETREVVRAVSADPVVTAKVMQSANSAEMGLARRLTSVQEAVIYVGRVTLQAWAAVMAFGDLRGEVPLATALSRGRMAQLLAPRLGADPAACFLAGLLSGLAAPFGMTMQQLLAQVPVDADVADALLHGAGPIAPVLNATLRYEGAELEDDSDPAPHEARQAYLDALRWSTRTVQAARS